MPCRLHPSATGGIAILSATAIAVTPLVAPTPPDARFGSTVQLSADSDWADVITRAGQHASTLANTWLEAPFPILRQIIANQLGYLQELPDVATIAEQIQTNFRAALAAPLAADPNTLETTHRIFYELLPTITSRFPFLVKVSPTGEQLLTFSTTSLSGALLGLVGPVVGPLVVLGQSLRSIADDLSGATPDPASAFTTLFNTAPAMLDAFLNGGVHVDVTSLVQAVGPMIGVEFPAGVQIGVSFGGLLSPGGSAFNALDFSFDQELFPGLGIHLDLATGHGPGLVGSLIDLTNAIARAIGPHGTGSSTPSPGTAATHNGLAAANEVPASALNSLAASSATSAADVTSKGSSRRAKLDDAADAVTDGGAGVADLIGSADTRKPLLHTTISDDPKVLTTRAATLGMGARSNTRAVDSPGDHRTVGDPGDTLSSAPDSAAHFPRAASARPGPSRARATRR